MADSKKYNGSTWEHSLRKLTTATEAVENQLYSDGTAITSYTIKGNTVQNDTPTPSNPVEVNGVGERTENLFDGTKLENCAFLNGTYNSPSEGTVRNIIYIPVIGGNTYTFSINSIASGTSFQSVCSADKPALGVSYLIGGNTTFITHGAVKTFTRTIPNSANWWAIQIMSLDNLSNNIMINEGSTAKPYEPYGYKIPISSGQQSIDIYIGDLPLLKSLDGTAVDEISNGTLTRRVDSDGSVLPTPTTAQIAMPSIPTTEGANTISVDTTVQPSEFTATWTGWHDASVKEWDGSDWN